MSITGLSNQYISQSFQGLLQVSSSGQLFDGDGNRLTLLDLTSSYAGAGNFATTGSNLFKGNQTISGSLTVTGNITAFQYIVSSSVINVTETNSSGSHIFGNSDDDTHQFTGSLLAPNMTGSLFGTASWARNSISASFTQTASYFAETDPIFVAKSGSFATTGSNTFRENQIISGSVNVSGSVIANNFTGSLLGTATSAIDATNASKVTVAASAVNSIFYPTFVDTTSGNVSVYVDTELTFNPFSNSLTATSFTGSLFGTSSHAVSSSYALTASFALNGGGGGSGAGFPFSGSAVITGSLLVSSSLQVTGSLRVSGSITGSLFGTASFATSASFAATASIGPGTVNYLPKFTTTTRIGNSIVYDNGTNVGISTAGPTVKLDVAGEGRFNGVHIGTKGVGTYNTRVGQNALNLTTSGDGNTAIGYNSMYNNDTGANNTAVGDLSLFSNVSGSNNVAIGERAGYSNLTEPVNTYIGFNAGQFHTTGSGNIIIGAYSGGNSTKMSISTIIGPQSTPGGFEFDTTTGSFIAIGPGYSSPLIWHNNLLEIGRGDTETVLLINPGGYSAAFIEYSLCNIAGNARSGYIKIAMALDGEFEYSEEVVTSVKDTYQFYFDIYYNGDNIVVDVVNDDPSDSIDCNLSCRLNRQSK